MNHHIHNWTSALETTRGPLHRLKMSWTFVHKRLKIGPSWYPPSVISAFYFISGRFAHRGQTNRTQLNFAKRQKVNFARNLPYKSRGRHSRKKSGAKNSNMFVFTTTSRLNDEYFPQTSYQCTDIAASENHDMQGLSETGFLTDLKPACIGFGPSCWSYRSGLWCKLSCRRLVRFHVIPVCESRSSCQFLVELKFNCFTHYV